MKFKLEKLVLAASACLMMASAPVHAQVEIQWWHSMSGALGEWINDQANGFNQQQKDYKVVPVFKGNYDESMTAAMAAFRAGNAPHLLQVFEVGTATMMGAKGAVEIIFRQDIGDKDKIAARTAEYEARFANPFVAASMGFIDEVIMPHATRKRIAMGLRKLRTKTLENPWKKHDNIPL